MGLLGKIETEKLRETVVKGHGKYFEIVITQLKESYKGVSVYKVFSELKYDGEHLDIIEYNSTYDRKESEGYFFMLERKYPEDRRKRRVF